MRDRHVGALVGLAVGDALGTTLEFKAPGTFRPIDDMIGGGPFKLTPGKVAVPTVKIEGSGTLQVPMHLLAADRAMIGFRALLDAASDIANRHGSQRK